MSALVVLQFSLSPYQSLINQTKSNDMTNCFIIFEENIPQFEGCKVCEIFLNKRFYQILNLIFPKLIQIVKKSNCLMNKKKTIKQIVTKPEPVRLKTKKTKYADTSL